MVVILDATREDSETSFKLRRIGETHTQEEDYQGSFCFCASSGGLSRETACAARIEATVGHWGVRGGRRV